MAALTEFWFRHLKYHFWVKSDCFQSQGERIRRKQKNKENEEDGEKVEVEK